MYVGDFNSHHELCKYMTIAQNGEDLVKWAEGHNIQLIFDAKEQGTFKLAAWRTEACPDLSFVTTDENNKPLPVSRRMLEDFPYNQYRS